MPWVVVFPPCKILQVKSLEVTNFAPLTSPPPFPLEPSSLLPLHFFSLKFPSLSFVYKNPKQRNLEQGSSYVLEIDTLVNVVANNCGSITIAPLEEAWNYKAPDVLVKKNTLAVMLPEGGLSK